MHQHPLLKPETNAPLLRKFLHAHAIDANQAPVAVVTAVARAFGALPYENLTKIIKDAETGCVESARRAPQEVLADHWAFGAGGTCFSLTATLLYLVRALGFEAEPMLADRRYGPNTHSALLVWIDGEPHLLDRIDGEPHLLDPGYLIFQPLPIPKIGEMRVPTVFNELILRPTAEGARVELHTAQDKRTTYRLTFKPAPVDAGEFLKAWDASFAWDMMHYPVLSRVAGDRQIYLQKKHLLIRAAASATRQEIPPDQLSAEIARQFGMAPALVARALGILKTQGEPRGWDQRA
jgi:arylamine N-acetyltransferase